MRCLFASDLHGHVDRYEKLWHAMERERPAAVFLGGDLLPLGLAGLTSAGSDHDDFVNDFLARGFEQVRNRLGRLYPRVSLILGNDDSRREEPAFLEIEEAGLWTYAHNRSCPLPPYPLLGYAFVPPTPFMLKDWEKYDVSRYVSPGSISPEQGWRSVLVPENEVRHSTIQKDLEALAADADLDRAVCLFHAAPHETKLDRAVLDGKRIDQVPLDVHIGSIAIRRFIEGRQPLLTLHGHVHESARLTGAWRDPMARTHMFGGAHDGPELALVRFDLGGLDGATRELI